MSPVAATCLFTNGEKESFLAAVKTRNAHLGTVFSVE